LQGLLSSWFEKIKFINFGWKPFCYGQDCETLIAIIAGAAVVLVPAGSLSRSYGTTLQPPLSGDYALVQITKYVPPPPKQKKKEEPTRTAYFNLKGAFGRPDVKFEELIKSYIV